jgi:hypothetical protein
MAYTINVQTTGQYDIKVRLTSNLDTAKLHIEIDGNNLTGTYAVPNTGGWEAYQLHTVKTNVPLTAGKHVLKIVSDEQWPGLDLFEITPSSPPAQAEFSCDFETGWTKCGFSEQAKVPGRATLVDFGRDGGKAVRLHTEPGDDDVNNSQTSERNDLTLPTSPPDYCKEGSDEWWALSIRFPDDYVVPPSGFGVVMAFHNSASDGQANFHIDAMPNTINGIPTGLRFRGHAGTNPADPVYMVTIGPVVKNVWYDFVYHVKWSSTNGSFIGWVKRSDQPGPARKLLNYTTGPTLYPNQGCYLKLANYHTPFGQPSSVIHDRVRRGKSAAEVVVPGQTLE